MVAAQKKEMARRAEDEAYDQAVRAARKSEAESVEMMRALKVEHRKLPGAKRKVAVRSTVGNPRHNGT
jgi:hypothetical protein